MPSHPGTPRARRNRRDRQIRPSLTPLEPRLVLSLPGAAGIAIDTSGDVFVSYDPDPFEPGTEQAVAEFNSRGFTVSGDVFATTGTSAYPGTLTMVNASDSLPGVSSGDILELQPNGQLFDFNPTSGASFQFDNLASYTASASSVYNVQNGASANLSSDINLANATFGDFGVYGNAIVVSAESNNWDFVVRLTYGSSGNVATVLVASPASDGLSDAPEGVAVDTQGTVVTTLPYKASDSSTAIHVPVGFNINYDTGAAPAPSILTLGLSSTPNIDSSAIAVDSENNFILAVTNSSLYGGGPGVAHINSALSAFLADPLQDGETTASAIAYQDVDNTNELALAEPNQESYTTAGELPLFSGQVTPAQLRSAYGINDITFTGPGGTTVTGNGALQTIAIVEEGVDPTLAADLATFDQFFGIAAPPSLQVIDQGGSNNIDDDIVGEASLDVEWAHAIAPAASIIVYNATYDPNNLTQSFENLLTGMKTVSTMKGVSVVTLSYGLPEDGFAEAGLNEQSFDSDFTTPGVTFLAAAGDSGIYGDGGFQPEADYPAASPDVIAVGGTSIVIDAAGDYPGTGTSGETAWGDGIQSGQDGGGGGGLSDVEPEPSWQVGVVPSSMDTTDSRALPDVSMDSGAAQEYDVFTSTLSGSSVSASAVGWLGDAGTSAASPIWAGLIAIADQGRVLAGGTPLTGYTQTLPALYSLASNPTSDANDFHDIVNGNNGDPAEPGYDLASGLGTPIANNLIPALADYDLSVNVPSQFSIQTEPPSSVAVNSTFGLTVQVEDSQGQPASGGTVTVNLGNNPGGATLGGTSTEPVVNGLATFTNLYLTEPGTGYTLNVTDSDVSGTETTSAITVTSTNKQTATLGLSGLSFTYDGLPDYATVTTNPVGLSGVEVTYTQDGVAVTNPTHAGDYTVTATLDNADYTAQPVVATLVIGKATPQVSWATPSQITVGTKLTSTQLDATASFDGTPLSGQFNYSPALGTVLPVGNDQTLSVSFVPADSTDFATVNASVPINVVPQSTQPAHAIIIGEAPVFKRQLNNRGKPTGKSVLTGFTLDYNMALSSSSASNRNNYELEEYVTEKIKRKTVKVLEPVTNFTVTYSAATHSVTVHLAGQSFPKGGELTVRSGVTNGSNSVLTGNTVFTITAGGKAIEP